ncbi:hypothetical protein ACFQV4_38465 [Streptomyces thermocarboxydus]
MPTDHGLFALRCERREDAAGRRRPHGRGDPPRPRSGDERSAGRRETGEWTDSGCGDGDAAAALAHLVLTAAHRSRRLGYGRKELARLLDATGVE